MGECQQPRNGDDRARRLVESGARVDKGVDAVPNTVCVKRAAMATMFSVTIASEHPRYARQAAAESLQLLDQLDALLSCFATNSDVARIGRCTKGRSIPVDAHTFDCLRHALRIEKDTGGAFNVAFRHPSHRPARELIRLVPSALEVRVAEHAVALDLGGIGKGYALDRMAAVLFDWELPQFLLRASDSTVLCGAPPPGQTGWKIQFGPTAGRHQLLLRRAAFSGSGTAVKGDHIRDPRSGGPAAGSAMTWAGAPTAAEADAFSTALMAMDSSAAQAFCHRRDDCLAFVLGREAKQLCALRAPENDRYR
jgi:thiamine biosynthesis lipoprotein